MLMINCAGTPDMNPVQEAEKAYKQIENDSLVVSKAPEALRDAQKAVADVRQAVARNEDQQTIHRQALIARQRVEIARKKAELKAAQDKVRRTSKELQSLLDNLRQITQDEMEAEERVKQLTNFNARQTNRGLVLRFKNISFDQEKAYLKSSAERSINELADFLDAYPERSVLIEGHTDNTGAASFNKTLSQQRANAVREALISRNVAGSRIKAVGLGEKYPRANNNTETGRQYNRRVEVIVSDKSGEIHARDQ